MPSAFNYPLTQGYGPTSEPLDSAYGGYDHFNKGFDFGAPEGTEVPAVVSGTVIQAGPGSDGWGISVKVKDAQGNIHNYGHLSAVNVAVGATVTAGQLLGAVGNTGASTGPHLSYDVLSSDGSYIDPTPFLNGAQIMAVDTTAGAGAGAVPGSGGVTDSGQSQAEWDRAALLGLVTVRSQGGQTYLVDTATGAFKMIAIPGGADPATAPNLQTFTAGGHVYIFNPATGGVTDTGIGSAAPTNQQAVTVNGRVYTFNPANGSLTDTGVGGPAPTPLQVGQTNSGAPFVFNPSTGTFTGPDGNPITDPNYFTQNSDLVRQQIAQIQANIELAQKQLENAIRAQDFNEYQFATTRLDTLARDANQFNLAIAGLSQTRELAGLNAQLTVATTNATLAAQAARDEAQMRFQSVESDRMRAFQAGEGTANRSLTAATAKAQYGLDKARIMDERKAAALAAAKQFGELISSTDPNAFRAFLTAGGGVIANALAGGNTAQSDLANLPAARTLRTLATPPEDIPDFQWTEPQNPALGMPPAVIPTTTPPPILIPPGFTNPAPLPQPVTAPAPAPYVPPGQRPPPYTAPPVQPRPDPTLPGTPGDPAHTSPTPPVAPGAPGSHIGVPINQIRPDWNFLTTGTGGDFDVSNIDPQLEVWDAARNQRITSGNLRAGTPYWFRAPTNWVPRAAAGGRFGGWDNAVITGDAPNPRERTGREELSLSMGPQMVVPLNREGQEAAGIDPAQGRQLREQLLGQGAPFDDFSMAGMRPADGRQPGQGAWGAEMWGQGTPSLGYNPIAVGGRGDGFSGPVSYQPAPPVPMTDWGGVAGPGSPPPVSYQPPPPIPHYGPPMAPPAPAWDYAQPQVMPAPVPIPIVFNPATGSASHQQATPQPAAKAPLPPLGAARKTPPADARNNLTSRYVPGRRSPSLSRAPSVFGQQEQAWQYPRAAAGGIYDVAQQAMNTAIAPEDQQYLDVVRGIRNTTDVPNLNPYSSAFFQRTAPTLREIFFRAMQGKYGIPGQDLEWEARRYQPMGLSRGGLRVGV